ncbi:MAG: hypothetical protein LBR26_13405 [Prevotella sp.]|jgi:hypothetical protein|nr:hypothetical protein [Prevotella sp.]
MNKIICNRIEIIHRDNIDENAIPLPGKKFIPMRLESPATYSGQSQSTDSGPVFNETLSARIKYSPDYEYLHIPLVYYILRIYSDSGSFIMGSPDYPAILAFTSDKIFADISFKSSKPL